MSKTTHRWHYILFNVAKGKHEGTIIVPNNDICYAPRIHYYVMIGYHGKALTYCKRRGRSNATIYELVESNQTTSFQLILKNGIKLPIKTAPVVLCSRGTYVFSRGSNLPGIVTANRKENSYQAVIYRVKLFNSVMVGTSQGRFMLNLRFYLFYLLGYPGPRGIELTEIYSPKDGLIEKGLGRTTFQETLTSFHPLSKDNRFGTHFNVNPDDGSILQVTLSRNKPTDRREYLTSVEIYKRVI
jgi:hypothetical protein